MLSSKFLGIQAMKLDKSEYCVSLIDRTIQQNNICEKNKILISKSDFGKEPRIVKEILDLILSENMGTGVQETLSIAL